MRLEERFLVSFTHPRLTREDARSAAAELAAAEEAGTVDGGYLIDQAAAHRVMPLVARNLRSHDIGSAPHDWLFDAAYLITRERTVGMLDELGAILRTLGARGLPVILRKGLPLVIETYGDLGVRRMEDIDLLARPADADGVTEALCELGYVQAEPTVDGRRTVPFDRQMQMLWRLHVDNLLPFTRTSGGIAARYHAVDVCRSLFQPQSGHSLPVDDLFERAVPLRVQDAEGLRLEREDALIDLCAHLHKEATALYYISGSDDLHLSKFVDVGTFLARHQLDVDRLVRRVLAHSLGEPVYFALHFTDLLYPGTVPEALLAGVRPASLQYLDEYGAVDGQRSRWDEDFLTRLFDRSRAAKAKGTSALFDARPRHDAD